ncbi:MAG: ABC transporter ATP-binding protein [Planctomycetota bacterium]
MSSESEAVVREPLITARGLGKAYRVYTRPEDRLKEILSFGRLKRHRLHWAVRDVDLDVSKGESVAILGRNGAGKSTLLEMICGTSEPTTGSRSVRGRVAPLLGLGAGMNKELTGAENLRLNAALWGLSRTQIAERYDAIAEFSELGEYLNQPLRTYSSGMQARLGFAVAAHVDADLLIVDETLAVGDAAFVQKCMRWVRSFVDRGTLLLVSHSPNVVMDLCDRAVWMEEGTVRAEGEAREVCVEYAAYMHEQATASTRMKIRTGRPQREAAPELPRSVDAGEDRRAASLRSACVQAQTEVGSFDPDGMSFGEEGALIRRVRLSHAGSGAPAASLEGGEMIELLIEAEAVEDLASPVIGFAIRNQRGLEVFGDNTFVLPDDTIPDSAAAGSMVEARFRFRWPYLRAGRYSVGAAIADGTPGLFRQQHRLDAALELQVRPSHVVHAVFAQPVLSCSMSVKEGADARD